MPLANWMKCTSGDLTGCRVDGIGTKRDDELAWERIYDDYIKQMGLDKMYKRLLLVMKAKAEIECDYVITNDRFKLTLLSIEETKLRDLIASSDVGSSVSIDRSLVYISKWVGSWLNPKELKVKEYFVLLKEMESMNSNIKNNG
jgi:hypothetical protein